MPPPSLKDALSPETRRRTDKQGRRLEVYNEVLACLRAAEGVEISPAFQDALWAHFHRLPARYALVVNAERAEDVVTHERLLEEARDPQLIQFKLINLSIHALNGCCNLQDIFAPESSRVGQPALSRANEIEYMQKLASSQYRGSYCIQDVAIKVARPERISADMYRDFAQEVYIMSKNRPVCTGNATTPAPPPALGRRALGQRSGRREDPLHVVAAVAVLGQEEEAAYGQTGSGKTHTMLGEISELGVKPGSECGMAPRIFQFLIARIRAEEESRRDENLKYNCKCSFLEIYNEQITDLLDPSSTNLQLCEDTRVGVYVENLTKREVTCVSDIITLLVQGSVNSKVSMTHWNLFTFLVSSTT
ncbi:Kinesin-like protein KIF15 [Hordeum vulgare]|nr:Kinesin-like protein KIF15 [Hordeum vulgare]